MTTTELFTASDAALRSVIDRLRPEDLDRPVPAQWSRTENPTLRDILGAQCYDEAWIPDVLSGTSAADGDDWARRDLLGDDPIGSYDELYDIASTAVAAGVASGTIFRFQYGDYPAEEGFTHLATYRAFQAYNIAHLLGLPFHLSAEIVDGMNEHVLPQIDEWRAMGVFPDPIDAPVGADDETLLLCAVGYWQP